MTTFRAFGRTIAAVSITAVLASAAPAGDAKLSAGSLFTDHMVVQRSTKAAVWGTGSPGATVDVRASWGKAASATVAGNGSWQTDLATPKAGGPYRLTITSGADTLTFTDVLVGEVWLCSGQSNMEMPLTGWPPQDTILSSDEVIRHSTNQNLRCFTVKRAFSTEPQMACTGAWVACSPASTPTLSATAYFFGRRIQAELNIPVGLIVSSWGGTVVDAWTSAGSLSVLAGYDSTLKAVAAASEDVRHYDAWLAQLPHFSVTDKPASERWKNLQFGDSSMAGRGYADQEWRSIPQPQGWEQTAIGDFDGVVWLRKSITIPASWVHQELTLLLGPIDDMDATFVNGSKVGGLATGGDWNIDRVYTVPGTIVDSTLLQIAVRVIDLQGGGGMYGPPGSLVLKRTGTSEQIDLSGSWRCLPIASFADNVFSLFGTGDRSFSARPRLQIAYGPNMPTALYNGMIAPLVPYALAGAIWYQGESDIFRAYRYTELFSTMIANWRRDFRRTDLPFYYTQIAPYDYGQMDRSAYLREAQLNTLSVPHTGMAVTIDIGNARNIHPANKAEVGERLARLALAGTYGKKVPCCGPNLVSVRKHGQTIELGFDNAAGGLVLIGGMRGKGFLIAGEDRIFRRADVQVKGSTLTLSSSDVPAPVAVRYAWSDTPEATLFNTGGLPASSFRTDHWSK
jgi:sialate O-acetylesterase